jgi:hypothetical protein
VVAIASVVSACGVHHNSFADANNDGTYVKAGPVTYQLEVSRLLNPYTPEDSGYLQGLSKEEAALAPNEQWYGVFLWAKNQTQVPQLTTNNFQVVDTEAPSTSTCNVPAQPHVYKPVPLSNPYAWASERLVPGEIEPKLNTTASFGPIGGGLVLFKVPSVGPNSVYANRPLTLEICGDTGKIWAAISLDL